MPLAGPVASETDAIVSISAVCNRLKKGSLGVKPLMNPVISGEPSSSSNPTYTTFILTIALVPLVLWINKFGKNIVQSTSMAAGLASSEKDPSGDFKGDIKVTTRLPSKEDVERVAELPVFDRDGGKHTFKSLYADNENGPRRVLIIFIRHFFCGVMPTLFFILLFFLTSTPFQNSRP